MPRSIYVRWKTFDFAVTHVYVDLVDAEDGEQYFGFAYETKIRRKPLPEEQGRYKQWVHNAQSSLRGRVISMILNQHAEILDNLQVKTGKFDKKITQDFEFFRLDDFNILNAGERLYETWRSREAKRMPDGLWSDWPLSGVKPAAAILPVQEKSNVRVSQAPSAQTPSDDDQA